MGHEDFIASPLMFRRWDGVTGYGSHILLSMKVDHCCSVCRGWEWDAYGFQNKCDTLTQHISRVFLLKSEKEKVHLDCDADLPWEREVPSNWDQNIKWGEIIIKLAFYLQFNNLPSRVKHNFGGFCWFSNFTHTITFRPSKYSSFQTSQFTKKSKTITLFVKLTCIK